ncbi:uncharacterized protein HMPREF1541_02469 [Cyphellophora europaea CBS 101466]|uniref:Uncharacterized protein n=1 Tax=Cyphellophora europaea (strain CBS 101466) TaxID=1220924 RepID=W2S3X6_CYPE1|nr:uncharacterized protein HMPREF1541_02469 [Cyphellophora europaea CBS 101466]ETN43310.1 hypothetical protein HMPREF1541_02469 [Cyphellophora europaea CBS 101466]
MSRPRADTAPKEPHSVSLKVLRLSRPTLAFQHPLPAETTQSFPISPTASLAYPSKEQPDQTFILSHNLSLPPSFGSAYVGETFSCSLCANNELPSDPNSGKSVSNIKILAEMQTPSSSIPLTLSTPPTSQPTSPHLPGSTLQHIITFPLKEEGTHVLAASVSYTETTLTPAPDPSVAPIPTSSRARSFRKLYQFPTVPCLSVRTKATELPSISVPDKTGGPYGRMPLLRYTLEAQLENVSDASIVLEEAALHAKAPFKAEGLNWDFEASPSSESSSPASGSESGSGDEEKPEVEKPILAPRDVHQLSYLLTQQQHVAEGTEELKMMLKRDGRAVLGQLSISWRGVMGEKGTLTTGNLLSRRRP